jgi:hypothetical protein
MFVLDFMNDAELIQKSFEPHYLFPEPHEHWWLDSIGQRE